MAANPINTWLAGDRDYLEGLTLFEKVSDKELTKSILRKGEGSITRKILETEMTALAETVAVVIDKPSAVWRGDDFKDLPDVVKDWIQQMKHLYKTNQHRKSLLEKTPDEDTRGEICNMILDDEDKINELKYKVNFYQDKRELPPETAPVDFNPEEMQPHEILKKIKQLGSQISKQKNNPLRADDVARWTEEKDRLKVIYDGLV